MKSLQVDTQPITNVPEHALTPWALELKYFRRLRKKASCKCICTTASFPICGLSYRAGDRQKNSVTKHIHVRLIRRLFKFGIAVRTWPVRES